MREKQNKTRQEESRSTSPGNYVDLIFKLLVFYNLNKLDLFVADEERILSRLFLRFEGPAVYSYSVTSEVSFMIIIAINIANSCYLCNLTRSSKFAPSKYK